MKQANGGDAFHRATRAGEGASQTTGDNNRCKRVCYLKMESKAQGSNASFNSVGFDKKIQHLNQVDGNLCTHLVLSSARNESNGNIALCNSGDIEYFKQVKEFKQKYKHTRVMVAVLINLNELNLLESRQKFVRSLIDFLQHFHLDGVDLDYHTQQQQQQQQQQNLSASSNSTTTTNNNNNNQSTTTNTQSTIAASLANSLTPLLSIGAHYRNDYEQRLCLIKLIKCLREAFVENFYDRQVRQANEQLQNYTTQTHTQFGDNINQLVEPYLLTISMQGDQDATSSAGGSYNNHELLRQLVNLCDWFNIRTFDYFIFKAYAPFAGPIAPLYPIVDSQFVPILNKLSLSSTLSRLLLLNGNQDNNNTNNNTNNNNTNNQQISTPLIPRDKLVLGIPTYARAYKLMFKQTQPTPFNLSVGTANGEYGSIGGLLTYKQVHELLMRERIADSKLNSSDGYIFVDYYDLRAKVPYLLTDNGYTWISYENSKSVREKVRFILDNELAGYMTWNLNCDYFPFNQDDVGGADEHKTKDSINTSSLTYDSGNFPLHKAMLEESLIPISTTTTTTTS